MADNPTTTLRVLDALENVVAGSGKVRTTDLGAAGHLQHVRLDLGAGTSEAQATGTVPVSEPSKATALNPGSVITVATTTDTEVMAANPTRVQGTLIPEAECRMSIGGAASATSGKLAAFTPFNLPAGYKGPVNIWVATGTVDVNVWDI